MILPIDNLSEDYTLLRKIAEGSEECFSQFYRKYGAILYATIYRVINDPEDTEDVLQEVLAQLWKKAKLYNAKRGKPLTWVVTMARNRAIDRIRSKERRSRLNRDYGDERNVLSAPEPDDCWKKVVDNERYHVVRNAVMALVKEQAQVIHLAYFEGLTQSEIASRLGEPVGTVKARIRRGMHKLRAIVPARL